MDKKWHLITIWNKNRYSVTKAIEFRKNMTTSNDAKAKCLKNDITNGPYHIFGFHDECDE